MSKMGSFLTNYMDRRAKKGKVLTHPQFKMCLSQDYCLHCAASTPQDTCMDYPLHPHFKMQSVSNVPTNSRYLCDYNSSGGPKCRSPQWLGADCEANTNTTICPGLYHLFKLLELSLNSACPTPTILKGE